MATIYQIRVKGHLDASRSGWFNGLKLTCHKDGTTDLVGPIPDQAALHGLLLKIRDLGLPLISLNTIEPDAIEPNTIEANRIDPKPTGCFPSR